MGSKLEELLKLCEALIESADNTGCTDDLTVVSADALNLLENWIVNQYGEE
jgi:hypothetical protein